MNDEFETTPSDIHHSSFITHQSPLSPLPSPLRSHTAVALAPVLAAGPFVERKPYDFAAEVSLKEGDSDIADLGRDARMPWEIDGRRWHTVDRVGPHGQSLPLGRPHLGRGDRPHPRAGRKLTR